MTAVTHQLTALTVASWLLVVYPQNGGPVLATIALIAVMVGALTPDLDQPAANLGNRLLGAKVVGRIANKFSGGHRHFTHSILGLLAIGYGLHWIINHWLAPNLVIGAQLVWWAFMGGYASHIIADTFTDRGVPWLWPLPWHFQLPPGPNVFRVTTGSFVELFILRGALLIVLVIIIRSNLTLFLNFWK
ncbi:MAG: metal-dependent hydrolase [bacterium]|nr:metal-dependent hydrolase [bacterium]